MGIGKIALQAAKCMFKNPSREGAKLYEQAPLGISLAFSGYSLYDAVGKIKADKETEAKESLLNAYTGMAAAFGSIFGAGGALVLGGGIKLLCEKNKINLA